MTVDTSSNASLNNSNVNEDSLNKQDTQEDTHSFDSKQSNDVSQNTQNQLFKSPQVINRNVAYHSKQPPSPHDLSPRYEQNSEVKKWEDDNSRYKLEIHQTQSQQSLKDLLPKKFNNNIHADQTQSYSSINENQSLSSFDAPLKKPYGSKEKNMDQIESKLVERNKEIQLLLEQRIALETELAAFRGSKNISSETLYHRKVDSLSPRHQKSAQIQNDSEGQPSVYMKTEEFSDLGAEKNMNADLKKKKKSGQKWFSFTRYKKNSKKPTKNDIEFIPDDLLNPETRPSDNLSLIENSNPMRAKKLERRDSRTFDVDTPVITSLQKDLACMTSLNASLQSEVQALKLELQSRFTEHELMQSSLGDTDKILFPFPFDKEKTPEQLQLLFEIQARALEKLSFKNTMLQNMLVREQNTPFPKTLEHDESPKMNSSNQCTIETEKPIENDLQATYQETLASLLSEKNTNALLEEKVRKLQTLLKEEKQRFSISVESLKNEINKYSVLSGNLVRKCESTQNELCKERVNHLARTTHYEEKLRRLKDTHSRMSPLQSLTDSSLTKTYDPFRNTRSNQVNSGFQKKRYYLAKEKVVNISFVPNDFSSTFTNSLNNGYCGKTQSPVFIEREENGYYLCETLPSRIKPSLKTIASPALIKWATTSEPVITKSSVPFVSSSDSNSYKRKETECVVSEEVLKTTVTPVLSDYRQIMSHTPTVSVPSHTTRKNCLQMPYALSNVSINSSNQPYSETASQPNQSSLQNIANMSSNIDPRNVLPLK